jgi:septal ring-binding cell division protein DamX
LPPAAAPPAKAIVEAAKVAQTQAAGRAADAPPEVTGSGKPGSRNYVPPAPPSGKLTRERFVATQSWLKSAPGDHYSVQLLTADARDIRRIEELLVRTSGRQFELADFHVYGVRINDRQHYRVAYGLYPSLAEVSLAIRNLPAAYRQLGPYHRSVDRMRSQNRQ